jgi:hypothetical protein
MAVGNIIHIHSGLPQFSLLIKDAARGKPNNESETTIFKEVKRGRKLANKRINKFPNKYGVNQFNLKYSL